MKFTKDKAIEKVNELLEESDHLWSNQVFSDSKFDQLVFGTLSLLRILYGEQSESTKQILQAKDLYLRSRNHGSYLSPLLNIIKGILSTLKFEISNDLTTSLEKQVQGEVFGDFMALSKHLLSEGHKESAVVLACGALEDSMKKFALTQGLDVYDKELSAVINTLKAKGYIKGAQSSVIQSYVQLRNKAFHAQFDKIETPEISSLLAFIEQFILENFK